MDPYASELALVKTKPVALLSPREKMPLEVTPFMPYLVRLAQTTGGSHPTQAGR
jgi:hypothetical protein